MKKAILSVLLLSAVCASPASANYFSNPIIRDEPECRFGAQSDPNASSVCWANPRDVVAENVRPARRRLRPRRSMKHPRRLRLPPR